MKRFWWGGLFAVGLGACGGHPETDSGENSDSGSVVVVLRASTEVYPHDDVLGSQTARDVRAGVRSLELLDATGERWVLIDRSPGNIEVGYSDGDTTELVRLDGSAVRPGWYVAGRMVQDWSRFRVGATLHREGVSTEGVLQVFQVTSEGALVDGVEFPSGYFEHVFEGPDGAESFTGLWVVPAYSKTAEAEAFVEDGAWTVYFPLDLWIEEGVAGTLEIEVNMDRAFRWSDVNVEGYRPDVYDIAPPWYEPIEQFGGNRFVSHWD